MSDRGPHIGIVGGGLCGLALAIALEKRGISYTIYEARASFTEIGAGINLGPNTIQAFDFIDNALTEPIYSLATRNEDPTLWMNMRCGRPTKNFNDGHLIVGIKAPPTGNMTVSRNEILQLLAKNISFANARFGKKLKDIQQDDSGVTLTFEDSSRDRADICIGADGAHSIVRRLMLSADDPAATAKFSNTGGYRAVFPMQKHEDTIGKDKAHTSHAWLGPGGYVVHYPIDGGKNVNIGFFPWKDGKWEHDSWVLPNQKAQMLKDYEAWGDSIQTLMEAMSDDTAFWATFHYSVKPESYFKGRICLIGDAAHSMTPHQGQGAAQSMEDACVIAEVLQRVDDPHSPRNQTKRIKAAFMGWETIRRPRFESVLDTSMIAFKDWKDLVRPDLTQADIDEFVERAYARFKPMWDPDIPGQCQKALAEMERILNEQDSDPRLSIPR